MKLAVVVLKWFGDRHVATMACIFLSCTYFMDVYGMFYASDMQFNLPILYIYAFIKLCV